MPLHSLVDLPAPAKLNLSLRLVGRRADGYHLLDGVMVPIDWHDTLHVERRADGRLARHDLGPALPADDLCLRAARALQQASGTTQGADLSIEKRVPQGAGLGGGSSDAATVLLGLNRLWRLDWPLARLLPIGTALGADVPFFLGGTTARAEGIGEILTPMAIPARTVMVVKPAAGLETKAVFGSPQVRALLAARAARARSPAVAATAAPTTPEAPARIAGFAEPSKPTAFSWDLAGDLSCGDGDAVANDLQAAACDLCPDVAEALALLRATCGNARMTGSGSAVWAVVHEERGTPAPALPTLPAGWSGRVCRTLVEHPLRGWAA